mmetsp:Transcript_36661/g.51115  ORF Transcript_36661/g.51115 Transcript_36661/m.51115 type:complete len:284 (+) Transcript_36661:104-955(+)
MRVVRRALLPLGDVRPLRVQPARRHQLPDQGHGHRQRPRRPRPPVPHLPRLCRGAVQEGGRARVRGPERLREHEAGVAAVQPDDRRVPGGRVRLRRGPGLLQQRHVRALREHRDEPLRHPHQVRRAPSLLRLQRRRQAAQRPLDAARHRRGRHHLGLVQLRRERRLLLRLDAQHGLEGAPAPQGRHPRLGVRRSRRLHRPVARKPGMDPGPRLARAGPVQRHHARQLVVRRQGGRHPPCLRRPQLHHRGQRRPHGAPRPARRHPHHDQRVHQRQAPPHRGVSE